MKLVNKIEFLKDKYECELTLELDKLAKLNEKSHYDLFYHYILADDFCKKIKMYC